MDRRLTQRLIALGYGALCHGLFAMAIGVMTFQLWWGLTATLFPLGSWWWNILLLIQFPLFHSWLLSKRGRQFLLMLAPKPYGPTLATTNFAILSSLQLIAVFVFWTPGEAWFVPEGGVAVVLTVLFAGAWILLVKAISDASPALHTGALGWLALWRGEEVRFPPFSQRGLYAQIRQPIYLGFALILLTGPVWSLAHLALLLSWGSYCVLGPLFKERRFSQWYGAAFAAYQEKVPYMFPEWFSRALRR